jgi:HAD superfamily hydrolase (TIGR01509 family)
VTALKAVVFDFDGLILETEGAVYRSWAEIYAEHGHEVSLDFWKTTIGSSIDAWDPHADLEARLGRNLDRAALRTRRRARQMELLAEQDLLPGVLELREGARAAGLKVGIASNSSLEWITGHLEPRGLLEGWDCIRTRADVARPKPAPDLYLNVVKCLDVEAEAAVAIEDSPHGVAAAKAAGLLCVAVPGPLTLGLDLGAADLKVASIADLTVARLAGLADR